MTRTSSFPVPLLAALALSACSPAADHRSTGSTSPTAEGAGTVGTVSQALNTRPARIWLTSALIQRLQQRAAAGDAAWTALKTHCDGLATGTMNPPGGSTYPNFPDVGQGYQGDGYLPEILALGLCYQTVAGVDATAAATYGAAGGRLLDAMATPASSGGQPPSTDDGYGIRFYGVGMAVGYDWLYPALSSTTRQQVITTLDAWIDWYDASGFSRSAAIGNYFAGYLLAKTTAAIALDGDDPKAAGYFSDVQTRMWGQLVQPSFSASMGGGGWPEGWEYGSVATTEVAEFLWAVKTGRNLDWWSALPQGRDQAAYIGQFAWPSRAHMDAQGTIHAGVDMRPPVCTELAMAAMLEANGDPSAPAARGIAADFLSNGGGPCVPWQAFLFGDPSSPSTPVTQGALSYFASGPNHVAARSSWQKDAVWTRFVSGQYINTPDSGEESFNEGAVTVVAGDQPIVVDATGWLPQAGGSAGEQFVYDDTWGNSTRLLDNTLHVAGATQGTMGPSQASTHVEGYEDLGVAVHARGRAIEQMYSPAGAITQFTRDFAYVRPGTVVVYDRTTMPASGTDQWMAWHTSAQPTAVTTTEASQRRYDVQNGGVTVGSIRTLAPSAPSTQTTSLVSGAAWRLEVHASAVSQDWLTTITAGAEVPDQVRLSAADGNVTAGGMFGVHLLGSPNQVVLFAGDHAAQVKATQAAYVVTQTADAEHVLFDMAPSSSGYAVNVTGSSGKLSIGVTPGGAGQPSSNGTLAFSVTMDGTVAFTVLPLASSADAGGGGSTGSGAGDGGPTATNSAVVGFMAPDGGVGGSMALDGSAALSLGGGPMGASVVASGDSGQASSGPQANSQTSGSGATPFPGGTPGGGCGVAPSGTGGAGLIPVLAVLTGALRRRTRRSPPAGAARRSPPPPEP